jgi:hypothetical protein
VRTDQLVSSAGHSVIQFTQLERAVNDFDSTAYGQKGGNMKKTIIAAVLFSLAFAVPILAA